MNLKLFTVMGVSWLLEIQTTIFDQNDIQWIIADIWNLLQGVLVFTIFAFKKKVWRGLLNKFGEIKLKKFKREMKIDLQTFVIAPDRLRAAESKYKNSSTTSTTTTNVSSNV